MTGVCWHDRPRWDCSHALDEEPYIRWGRCRTGQRWFWTAQGSTYTTDGAPLYGTADTEEAATAAAREAVEKIAAGRPAVAARHHGDATALLRKLNADKRAARPAPETVDAGIVEYLYGTRHWVSDDYTIPDTREVIAYRITRKTPKRVYYIRRDYGPEGVQIACADRAALERDGHASHAAHWWDNGRTVYATREAAEHALGLDDAAVPDSPDLRQLRLAMANAHPDRGGTAEAFMAARQRYERALREAS